MGCSRWAITNPTRNRKKKKSDLVLNMHVPHHQWAIQLNPSMKRKCHLPLHCVWRHLCGAGGKVSNLLACWVSCFKMAARPVRPLRLMASFQAGDSDRGLDRFLYLVGTIRNTKERPRLSVHCPSITNWRRRLLLLGLPLVDGDVLQPTQHRPWH